MKLGLITSIFDRMDFKQVVDFSAEQGLECLEVACWPKGGAERRYAGVSHIDVDRLDENKAKEILDYAGGKKITISALAFYPNTMDPDLEKRAANVRHLNKVIDAAALLGVNMVTTFVGRVPDKTVEENLKLVEQIWPPIVRHAEEKGVKIAIENCPMLFTGDEWPGGKNLMTTPAIFRKIFKILDSPNFGLNFDPSHFVWQQLDYIKPLYEFRDKIFQVHFKDIKLLKDRLADAGTMALPLEIMVPKIPGLGDVDWGRFVSALTDIGFDGNGCIEIEDKSFERKPDDAKRAVIQSIHYLRNFVS